MPAVAITDPVCGPTVFRGSFAGWAGSPPAGWDREQQHQAEYRLNGETWGRNARLSPLGGRGSSATAAAVTVQGPADPGVTMQFRVRARGRHRQTVNGETTDWSDWSEWTSSPWTTVTTPQCPLVPPTVRDVKPDPAVAALACTSVTAPADVRFNGWGAGTLGRQARYQIQYKHSGSNPIAVWQPPFPPLSGSNPPEPPPPGATWVGAADYSVTHNDATGAVVAEVPSDPAHKIEVRVRGNGRLRRPRPLGAGWSPWSAWSGWSDWVRYTATCPQPPTGGPTPPQPSPPGPPKGPDGDRVKAECRTADQDDYLYVEFAVKSSPAASTEQWRYLVRWTRNNHSVPNRQGLAGWAGPYEPDPDDATKLRLIAAVPPISDPGFGVGSAGPWPRAAEFDLSSAVNTVTVKFRIPDDMAAHNDVLSVRVFAQRRSVNTGTDPNDRADDVYGPWSRVSAASAKPTVKGCKVAGIAT